MEFIRFLGLRDLMFEYWTLGSRCFDTCYHEFMSLIKLYLVNFSNLFLFFICIN